MRPVARAGTDSGSIASVRIEERVGAAPHRRCNPLSGRQLGLHRQPNLLLLGGCVTGGGGDGGELDLHRCWCVVAPPTCRVRRVWRAHFFVHVAQPPALSSTRAQSYYVRSPCAPFLLLVAWCSATAWNVQEARVLACTHAPGTRKRERAHRATPVVAFPPLVHLVVCALRALSPFAAWMCLLLMALRAPLTESEHTHTGVDGAVALALPFADPPASPSRRYVSHTAGDAAVRGGGGGGQS